MLRKLTIPVGTRSLLFGAHQFLIHPLFVAAAWWKLYGFPRDWRLWLCFYLHDIGYWGMPNMDGPEGEKHPFIGAAWVGAIIALFRGTHRDVEHWYMFCLCHSRFLAQQIDEPISRLCVADKYAAVLTPAWLYLPMTMATGEVWEYMGSCSAKTYNPWQWYKDFRAYMAEWVIENREGGTRCNKSRYFYEDKL